MDDFFSFASGIVIGILIMIGVGLLNKTDLTQRVADLERQQAHLIEMLTYVPEIDIPEVVKTIRPKVIGKQ